MAIKFLNDGDFPDNAKIRLGDANDLEIYHDATDSTIENKTGDFIISNNANDKDILFKGDTGGGGLATYFFLDGSLADGTYKYTRWVDYSVVSLGTGNDLQLFHDSTKSRVENLTGNLEITQKADDSDIIFQSDDGSGGTTPYMTIDGSATKVTLQKDLRADDDVKIQVGSSGDLFMVHESNTSKITNGTGNLEITQNTDDGDIIFNCDDGSGGTTQYLRIDGGVNNVRFLQDAKFGDNVTIKVGEGGDLQINHNGTNSEIDSKTGNLNIKATNTDGDIKFFLDDGAGSTTQYVRMDGGAEQVLFFKSTEHQDNVKATFGNAGDLEIYHNASNSIIEDSGTGDLVLKFSNDLLIEGQDGANLINCNEGAGVQLYHNNNEKLETQSDGIQVTGNIDIDSNGEIELDGNGGILLNTAPSGNEGNGIIIKLHSSTTVAGSIYYKSHLAAAWSYTTANDSSTTRMLAVALGTNSGTDGMLLQGIFRKASHGFSAGAPLYIGATNGTFTTTAPSTGGQYARVVGYVVDSNHIYFSPGTAWVEVG